MTEIILLVFTQIFIYLLRIFFICTFIYIPGDCMSKQIIYNVGYKKIKNKSQITERADSEPCE